MKVFELQQQLILLCDELRKEEQEKFQALAKTKMLELKVEATRDSEKKMLESLISQTKLLEQTKIALEEAKLEIKHLNKAIRIKEDPKETQKLQVELKQALDAEDKSKKAMDDLAMALKEVTTESNRAKRSYFQTQFELENLRTKMNRLKSDIEESSASWRAKENGFINSMKISEEEIANTKKENKRLNESKISTRQEISNLRDIVKQAVKESNIAKEALEKARDENSKLKNLLSKRECALSNIKQDYEIQKVTEVTEVYSDSIMRFPSENWSLRWNSIKVSKVLEGSIFDMLAPSTPTKERDGIHEDHEMFDKSSPMRKKRQGLRRFGDMLRIRSFNK